jgi:site-specific recombinase XerD
MQKTDLPYYVTNFFAIYLPGQKNLSKNTIASYAVTFKLFFIFCKDKKNIPPEKLKLSMLNESLVTEFLDWLESDRNCSVTTRNQCLVSLHSFFRFVLVKDPACMDAFIKILKIPYKKTTKTIVPYLSEEDMKILLAQPDGKSWSGFRDKVMLSVLYDSGARVQELVDLRVKDVRTEAPAVITLHGKGDKIRQVPIMSSTAELLKNYLEKYKPASGIAKGDQPLFINQKKQSLSRWGITYIINKYVDKARGDSGFKADFNITPHVFRHSKAVHMVRAGINLIYIRDFLGHVDCYTTEIYARIDTETKRKAIERACKDIFPEGKTTDWTADEDLMSFLETLV